MLLCSLVALLLLLLLTVLTVLSLHRLPHYSSEVVFHFGQSRPHLTHKRRDGRRGEQKGVDEHGNRATVATLCVCLLG